MSDTPLGDGWWQASDGKFYAPEQHPDYTPPPPPPPPAGAPPPPAAAAAPAASSAPVGGGTYRIKEDGKNGTVEIAQGRLIRTHKKTLGKDDIQTIPIKAISAVDHDRRGLGSDIVRVTTAAGSYEWKVSNAEQMVAEIHAQMF